MCGVRMTFGRPRSSESNSSPRPFGSSGKTSTAAPAMCPDSMCSRSASWSTTKPRDRLRNRRPRPHPGELLLAEEAGVARPAVDVEGHDVGLGEQLVAGWRSGGRCRGRACRRCRRRAPSCRAPRRPPRAGCRCCRSRRCRACGRGPRGGPRPTCPRRRRASRVLLGQPAGQRDDLGDGQLDDAAGVGERRVEHGDARLGGRGRGRSGWCRCRTRRRRAGRGPPRGPAGDLGLDRMPSRLTPWSASMSSASSEGARRSRPRYRPSSVGRSASGWMFSSSKRTVQRVQRQHLFP